MPLTIRSATYPAVAFASNAWIWLLLAGAFLQVLGLVAVALVLYSVAVLFHVVTLPVEFNASRRDVAAAAAKRPLFRCQAVVDPRKRIHDLRIL